MKLSQLEKDRGHIFLYNSSLVTIGESNISRKKLSQLATIGRTTLYSSSIVTIWESNISRTTLSQIVTIGRITIYNSSIVTFWESNISRTTLSQLVTIGRITLYNSSIDTFRESNISRTKLSQLATIGRITLYNSSIVTIWESNISRTKLSPTCDNWAHNSLPQLDRHDSGKQYFATKLPHFVTIELWITNKTVTSSNTYSFPNHMYSSQFFGLSWLVPTTSRGQVWSQYIIMIHDSRFLFSQNSHEILGRLSRRVMIPFSTNVLDWPECLQQLHFLRVWSANLLCFVGSAGETTINVSPRIIVTYDKLIAITEL